MRGGRNMPGGAESILEAPTDTVLSQVIEKVI